VVARKHHYLPQCYLRLSPSTRDSLHPMLRADIEHAAVRVF